MKKEIYYATSNPGKFDEVRRFIEIYEPSILLKQYDGDIFERQTNDAKAIAIEKAQQAWQILKKPILVDDAGIYFNQYKNFPGTMTKFIIESIGYEGVFSLLKNGNAAYFLLYLVYLDETHLETFEGKCEGQIVRPKTFDAPQGLPWDAIFLPEDSNKTYSEIRNTPEETKYAYRLRAVKKFLEWHKQNNK